MYKFLQGTKIIIEVLFPGEFRIGWEYEGVKYVPGSGSYYDLDTALDQAWQAFCKEFPHLTKRALDGACESCKLELTPQCPIRTGNGCDLFQPRQ